MERIRSAAAHGALPVELTSFIGRERELESLRALIGASRLLTLTGAGGSGKSRLALELAPVLADAAPEGVHWVELAPLGDESLLVGEVMRSLGSPSEGGATAEAVAKLIGERRCSLVLDNCEHLVDACARMVDALLRSCPNLIVLATSREALGVRGERAWLVPPLSLPGAGADPGALEGSDAVRLFIERARDLVPDFAVTPQNAAVVAEICRRVDGIPLAIELAAARIRHMSPEQIRARLDDAFALLTTGPRTALPRHRTLRATLDWSHDLLRDDARVVLRRLSVFRGGFTLDAVEAVAAGDGIDLAEVLDLVAVLVDRSMIVVREQQGYARYHLLETVRQYAAQRLRDAGEEERTHAALADYVTAIVAAAEPAFITRERRAAFGRLEPELDNIREVLHWTRAHRPRQHVRLVGMLWWFWFSTQHWVEAHRWIMGALALPEAAAPDRERAMLLFAAGALGSLRAQVDAARPLLREAAEIAATCGEDRLRAYALNYLGMAYGQVGSPEAREHSGPAAEWFRAHDDLYGLRLALLILGIAEMHTGNVDEAMKLTREAVDIARTFGQDRELAIALQNLTLMMLVRHDIEGARVAALESVRALRRDPAHLFTARSTDYLAIATAPLDARAAAVLIGASDAIRGHIGADRFALDQRLIAEVVARLSQTLGDAEYSRAYGEGRRMSAAAALMHVFGFEDRATGPAEAMPATAPAAQDAAVTVPATPAPAPHPVSGEGERPASRRASEPAPPDVDLDVRVLGPMEVRVRGRLVEAWPYAKPKELLAMLALHPAGLPRAAITEAMWPGATPAQTRNSFHVTMHHLRRTLEQPGWVVLEDERYRLAAGVSVAVDADRFEREARAHLRSQSGAAVDAVRATVGLYRGHVLADELVGDWRDEPQDRLRRIFCDLGLLLGGLLEEAGDSGGAAEAYQRVIAAEPLHEEAHRRLLRCWVAAGERARALRHYDRLATTLRDELDMEPEPETIELYDRIRSGDVIRTDPPARA